MTSADLFKARAILLSLWAQAGSAQIRDGSARPAEDLLSAPEPQSVHDPGRFEPHPDSKTMVVTSFLPGG